jgi:hypothetical protein
VILSEIDVSPHIIYIGYAEGSGQSPKLIRVAKAATTKAAYIGICKSGMGGVPVSLIA